MKKSIIKYFSRVLAVSVFAGCGSKTEDNSQAAADNSTTPRNRSSRRKVYRSSKVHSRIKRNN